MTDANKALDGIRDYLSSGGLFNPELMDHAAVRDLIINCRDTIDALKERENVTDELMASQYRAGAQAGWNAAQLIWPKSQEAIARLTNVEKGDLEHIRAANARRAPEAKS